MLVMHTVALEEETEAQRLLSMRLPALPCTPWVRVCSNSVHLQRSSSVVQDLVGEIYLTAESSTFPLTGRAPRSPADSVKITFQWRCVQPRQIRWHALASRHPFNSQLAGTRFGLRGFLRGKTNQPQQYIFGLWKHSVIWDATTFTFHGSETQLTQCKVKLKPPISSLKWVWDIYHNLNKEDRSPVILQLKKGIQQNKAPRFFTASSNILYH